MIYKNIELFNVSDLTPDGAGGMILHRFPLSVEQALPDKGKQKNTNNTGVEFRFRLTGDRVTIKLRMEGENAIGTAYIYQGAVLRGSADCTRIIRGDRITEMVIEPVDDMNKIRCIQDAGQFPFNPELVRVVLNGGIMRIYGVEGDCEPPRPTDTPARTYLAYGSSITHGSESLAAPHSFVAVAAQNLGLDLRNLGMPGACRMEPEIAQHIAQMGQRGEWDIATLCMGINVLSWEREKIEERVRYMIETVSAANPRKHIFCISPIYCHSDIKKDGKAKVWREVIGKLVKEQDSDFVHYLNGLELLDSAWGLTGDRTHPSPIGVRRIAEKLTEFLKEFCNT